jgi:AcrR family transcriptional regulator
VGIIIRFLIQRALLAGDGADSPSAAGAKPVEGARARVLDAAVAHFAAEGFTRPGLEKIARTAGVSTRDALVLFESEDKLREACDDYVLSALVGWAQEKATLAGMSQIMSSYIADPGGYQAQLGYLGRVVSENTRAAARFTDVLVDESESIIRAGIKEGTMRPFDDPRALAVLLAVTVLGMVTMAPHIERTLGVPASQQEMLLRLAVPAMEVYTHGLYTDDSYLTLVREAVSALRPAPYDESAPGPESPGPPPHRGGS